MFQVRIYSGLLYVSFFMEIVYNNPKISAGQNFYFLFVRILIRPFWIVWNYFLSKSFENIAFLFLQ